MRKLCKSLCKSLVQGHKCWVAGCSTTTNSKKIIQTSCSGRVTIRVMRETSNPRNVKLEDPHLDFITAHKGSRGPNDRHLDQTVFSRGVPLKGPKTSATQMAAISYVVTGIR